jgi:DNA-binding MarR family transcriptional regulator
MSIIGYGDRVGQEGDTAFTDSMLTSTGYLLYRTGAEARRRWAQMLGASNLTPQQFGVLMTLDQHGTLSQRELSAVLGIDPRNAVAVIDALQERGLLQRRPDPLDRRRHALTLTGDGRAAAESLKRAGDATEDELIDALDARERRTLHRLLLKIHTASRPAGGGRG